MHMRKTGLVIAAITVFLMLSTSAAAALPLGSTGHNQRFTMVPGETRTVELTFFNYGKDPLYVSMDVSGSSEIRSATTPTDFILQDRNTVDTPIGETKSVCFDTQCITAVPVTVRLRVPSDPDALSKTFHKVKVSATAQTQQSGSTERISRVNEYSYHITIPGNVNPEPTEEEDVETPPNFNQPLPETTTSQSNPETNNGGGDTGSAFESGGTDSADSTDSGSSRDTDTGSGSGETVEEQETGSAADTDTPTGFFTREQTGSSSTPLLPLLFVIGVAALAYGAYRRY